jgi:hypothetical protein
VIIINQRDLGDLGLTAKVVGMAAFAPAGVDQAAVQPSLAGPLVADGDVTRLATGSLWAAPGDVATLTLLFEGGVGRETLNRPLSRLGGRQRARIKQASAVLPDHKYQKGKEEESRATTGKRKQRVGPSWLHLVTLELSIGSAAVGGWLAQLLPPRAGQWGSDQ